MSQSQALQFGFTPRGATQGSCVVVVAPTTADARGIDRLRDGRAAVCLAAERYCQSFEPEAHWLAAYPDLRAGEVGEIRVYVSDSKRIHKPHWLSYYFSTHESYTRAVRQTVDGGKALGIYQTVNPVNGALRFSRRADDGRVIQLDTWYDGGKGISATNGDITRFSRLVFDFDPIRPSKTPSTDAELYAAVLQAEAALEWLCGSDFDFPEPLVIMSGNGVQVALEIESLAARDGRWLIEHVLRGVARFHDTPGVKVDLSLGDPAQLMKIPGTPTRKGTASADRPFRWSRVMDHPAWRGGFPRNTVVLIDKLEAVAALAPTVDPVKAKGSTLGDVQPVIDFFKARKITAVHSLWNDADMFVLYPCPVRETDNNGGTQILRFADGGVDFKCKHANCGGKSFEDLRLVYDADTMRELETALKVARTFSNDVIPVADVSPANIDKAWELFSAKNDPPGLFLRAGKIVMLKEGPPTFLHHAYAEQIKMRPESEAVTKVKGFREITDDTFRDMVGRGVTCVKRVRNVTVETSATQEFSGLMLASPFKPLPDVIGLATVPFYADGALVTTPGLHARSGMFYCPDPTLTMPAIPVVPTDADLALALTRIDDLVWQFPFADRAPWTGTERGNPDDWRQTSGYAHALAFVLSVLMRGMLSKVPLFLFNKPKARTGASVLVECLSYLVLGDWPRPSEWDRSQAERRKFLTSVLMTGTPIVYLDDVKDLISDDLRKVLTGTGITGRELGKTNILDGANTSVIVATGNNPRHDHQGAGRMARIQLDANMVNPEDRSYFVMVPERWVPEHRGDVLWAFYVLAQRWIANGSPLWKGRKLSGFEVWSETIGGVLQAAKLTGFLTDDPRDDAESDGDTTAEADATFCEEWITAFGSKHVTVKGLSTLENRPTVDGLPLDVHRLGVYLRERRNKWLVLSDGKRQARIERVAGSAPLWFVRVRLGHGTTSGDF